MRCLGKGRFRLFQGQRGISLIETIIALGILGLIAVAFLTGLSTTSRSVGLYEQRVTASALAQSQLEEIKGATFDPDGNYPIVPDHGYTVSVKVEPIYVCQGVYEEKVCNRQVAGEPASPYTCPKCGFVDSYQLAVDTEGIVNHQKVTVAVSRGEHFILKMTTIKADW